MPMLCWRPGTQGSSAAALGFLGCQSMVPGLSSQTDLLTPPLLLFLPHSPRAPALLAGRSPPENLIYRPCSQRLVILFILFSSLLPPPHPVSGLTLQQPPWSGDRRAKGAGERDPGQSFQGQAGSKGRSENMRAAAPPQPTWLPQQVALGKAIPLTQATRSTCSLHTHCLGQLRPTLPKRMPAPESWSARKAVCHFVRKNSHGTHRPRKSER